MKFEDFGFDATLMQGIESMGYENPTPIQEQAIPEILKGKDIIASAQTGTGKTGAFLLPLINKMIPLKHDDHVKALVIVPTRELAVQIDQQMEGFSYFTPVSSIPVYGGGSGDLFARERDAFKKGADMIICTPGRMLAHLHQAYVKFDQLKYLVLDEADRMLDMGFLEDITRILSHIPKERQNLLFSATMPAKILDLAKKVLKDPVEIKIALSRPPDKIAQAAFVIYEKQKIPLVKYILSAKRLKSVLVFCSTKVGAKDLNRELKKTNLAVEEIHSDLDQSVRQEVLRAFRSKKLNVLVATDVLSRGIDIDDIDLVINYDVPNDGEDYIHRIGRTARAASKGMAITLINEKDQAGFAEIETLLGKEVQKATVPPQFGETPAYNPNRRNNKDKYRKKRPNKRKR